MASERDKILQSAQRYAEQKRYDRAVEEYRRVLQEDPNDARVLLKMGDAQTRAGDYAGAIETYERVGAQYASQGFAVKAIAVYKQVRELLSKKAPELADRYAHIHPKLAEIYVQLGLTSDAIAAYDEVATRYQKLGRDREAVGLFRKMAELDGGNPLVQLRLAEALVRTSATDQAIEAFWAAAELLMKLGRADQALKVLERILHFRQDPKYARVAAELYLQRNTREDGLQALAKLQICFQQDPKDLETLKRLAQAFQVIGSREKAIEVYKEMARISREKGDQELFRELVTDLEQVSPDDEGVKALIALRDAPASSPPESAGRPQPVEATRQSAPPAARAPQASAPEISEVEEVELLDDDLEEENYSTEVEPVAPEVAAQAPHVPSEAPAPIDEAHAAETAYGQPAAEEHYADASAELPAGESIQEYGDGSYFDADAHARKAIVDSESFRTLGLFSKAVETLSIALEIDPRSIPIREKLVQILSEAGEQDLALNETVNVASLYYDEGNLNQSQVLLEGVLAQSPEHPAAVELLQRVYYYQQQGYGQDVVEEAHAAEGAAYDPGAPLPSYDLEEVSPSRVIGGQPTPSIDAVDEPFGEAPLPSFPLATGSDPGTATEGIEDVLEEAEFFAARGLYDDARAILDEQLQRAPGHPLLLERLQEVNEMEAHGGEVPPPASAVEPQDGLGTTMGGGLPAEFDDAAFDLAASLDPVDDPSEAASNNQGGGFASLSQEVDVDQVFEKFKEGVRAQVSESDSATHYDLGVAYKEMGLTADAISEFELAARDPKRTCMCFSMIGMMELQQNNNAAAIEAYRKGLDAEVKSPEQELSLTYDLAHAYELEGSTDQALHQFRRIEKLDDSYRDVKDRIAALTGDKAASGARAINEEDEFDSIFDDLFESK